MNKNEILELLYDIQAYLDDYIDIKDSDDGPVPNTAMRLDSKIEEMIKDLENDSNDLEPHLNIDIRKEFPTLNIMEKKNNDR